MWLVAHGLPLGLCGVLFMFQVGTDWMQGAHPSLLYIFFQFLPTGHMISLGIRRLISFKALSFFLTLFCRALTCCWWPSEGLCDVLLNFFGSVWAVHLFCPLCYGIVMPPSPFGTERVAPLQPLWTVFCPAMIVIWHDHLTLYFLILGFSFLTCGTLDAGVLLGVVVNVMRNWCLCTDCVQSLWWRGAGRVLTLQNFPSLLTFLGQFLLPVALHLLTLYANYGFSCRVFSEISCLLRSQWFFRNRRPRRATLEKESWAAAPSQDSQRPPSEWDCHL